MSRSPSSANFCRFFFGGRVPLLKKYKTEKNRYPYSNLSNLEDLLLVLGLFEKRKPSAVAGHGLGELRGIDISAWPERPS